MFQKKTHGLILLLFSFKKEEPVQLEN